MPAHVLLSLAAGAISAAVPGIVNVCDFGTDVGESLGTVSDHQAFQDAGDSLADTGGAIYAPPALVYGIAEKVRFASHHPIWLISHMAGSGTGGTQAQLVHKLTAGHFRPLAGVDHMFEWGEPDDSSEPFDTGGGGCEGLVFLDYNAATGYRNISIDAAIHLESCGLFWVSKCILQGILGSALLCNEAVAVHKHHCYIQRCGDTDKSAVQVGVDGHFSGLYSSQSFIESCFGAPYFNAPSPAVAECDINYFEASDALAGTNELFQAGQCRSNRCTFNTNTGPKIALDGNELWVTNCKFDNGPTEDVPTISIVGNKNSIKGNKIFSGGLQTGAMVTITGDDNHFNENETLSGGHIVMAGTRCSASRNTIVSNQGTSGPAIIRMTGTLARADGNLIDGTQDGMKGILLEGSLSTARHNTIANMVGADPISVDASGVALADVEGNLTIYRVLRHLAAGGPIRRQEREVTTTVATNDHTLTVTDIVGGRILHTPPSGAGTVTTDSAANLIAGTYGPVYRLDNDGLLMTCIYHNLGAFGLTFQGGSGVTMLDASNDTLAAHRSCLLRFIRTGAGAVTCELVSAID